MDTRSTSSRERVVLIGSGNVSSAVTLLLQRAGCDVVGVSSRSHESANRAAARLSAPVFDHHNELPPCDWLLIGAGDDAIAEIAATVVPFLSGIVKVCHFSGVSGTAPLAATADRGGVPMALHPVQACPDIDTAVARLPGSAWGVTCPPEAAEAAEGFVERLGGTPVWVEERDRPVWHAASVTVSNGIAALMTTGEAMLRSIGVATTEEVLGPLAEGTIQNARGRGAGPTLTGPVVRGERATVRRHLETLEPDAAATYRLVARLVVVAARSAHRIDPETAREMLEVIESG